jgi:hypothetical protein
MYLLAMFALMEDENLGEKIWALSEDVVNLSA